MVVLKMIESLYFPSFMLNALLAGLGVALIAGPLGSFILWRRMAYFGDTLSHSTLSGVGIAVLLSVSMYVGLFAVCVTVSFILILFMRQKYLATDAIFSIISHFMLAVGLIMAALMQEARIDVLGLLYGDILSVNQTDLYWVAIIDVIVFIALLKLWRPLLSLTVQEDIAAVEGININLVKSCFMLLLALVFAVAMKLIGALLITALLVIPASSARQLVNSPKHMAILASFFSGLSVFLGLYASLYYDWPTGPAIICMATGIFVVTWTVHQYARKEG